MSWTDSTMHFVAKDDDGMFFIACRRNTRSKSQNYDLPFEERDDDPRQVDCKSCRKTDVFIRRHSERLDRADAAIQRLAALAGLAPDYVRLDVLEALEINWHDLEDEKQP